MDTTKTKQPGAKPRQADARPQGTKHQAERSGEPRKKAPSQQQTARKSRPPQKKAAASRQAAPERQRMTRDERNDTPNKKRAYGKSKAKKPSVFETLSKAAQETAKQNAARKKAREARQGKKRPKKPTPAIIYTQPQVFNRSRLTVQLVTVLAVVLALVMGMNVFFKVGTITVSGADVYTVDAVIEASGIQAAEPATEDKKAEKGDGLFTFSRTRAAALIMKNLPYVKNVSFGIKLPETVNIIIEEEDVVYSIQDLHEEWWLINSEGRVVQSIKSTAASNYTKVLGVNLKEPIQGMQALAAERADILENSPTEATEPTDSTDPSQEEEGDLLMGTTGAQRLTTALEILRALEDNDIVGSAASVDVSSLEDITLWYGTRYQVGLGDSGRLHEKIDYMNDVIHQMSDYQSGILDISFRIWTNQVGYTPFS